ncbi:mogroside IE synthase-like [Mangifera indica]|uniref:mogroside IE synthase-like n=1 Tax=Mangifera indica TaxID=29780 RepID=UPI001CFBE7A2|nr:mogroside IE synthase-like [Mangifera indica]
MKTSIHSLFIFFIIFFIVLCFFDSTILSFGKKMGEQKAKETHILTIPFPAQGHINPMLQLSKRLASKNLRVTLVTTTSSRFTIQGLAETSSIKIEPISDGFETGVTLQNANEYSKRFRVVFPQSLAKLVEKYECSGCPVKFIVYDSAIPWMLDVARGFGLDGAPFFTQPWAVNAIYYHFHQGKLEFPVKGSVVSLPAMPPLGIDDLPSFISEPGSYPSFLDAVLNQFSNIHEPKWTLCNTFLELEDEVVNFMASKCPIQTIGPTIPSIYLDKRLQDDNDYGLSLFKPMTETCKTWLDSKEINSVVYVSFGSLAALGEEQMEEIAWGLKRSNFFFLWVVREPEFTKLPRNFPEESSEKGLVVSWSPQLEVLAHKSVGCFLTHCGWNSTLEALSLGVPMVAMPQWTDQTTNAKFVEDVWQVGVRVRANEKRIVTREEIEICIKEVMEGERSNNIRKNTEKWKKLAKEAVDEGGSSDKNLEEFVTQLLSS